ncbi:MAG: sigma-70 family RNA polymerase sigma factor [Actinomycetota bacterium]
MTRRPVNAVEAAFRTEWPALVATLARDVGDLALAEDVVSSAFVEATERWHRDGIPRRPGAWLLTTARRRAIDLVRRDRRFTDRMPLLVAADDGALELRRSSTDDRLAMIFACCHPALAPEAQVALTLRYVAGLSTGQIARAFLVPEPTMAKRLVRAKQKVAAAGIPIEVPAPDRVATRLDSVCGVVHAVFTEGHASAVGVGLVRGDLCDEALYLADTLVELLPDSHDTLALRALCRLTDARRATRSDADGLPILLRDQDRSLWSRQRVTDGLADLAAATALVPPEGASPFLLRAMLAGIHSGAPSWEATNWSAIVSIYDSLLAGADDPVVRLNRAIAVAERDGAAAGLVLLDELASEHHDALGGYHYFPAARADLLVRLGRTDDAESAFGRAIDHCHNDAERRWLERRRTALGNTRPSS